MASQVPSPGLQTFANYSHLESTVEAICLSADTQYDVVTALGTEAEQGKLIKLNIEFNDSAKCYEFTYRYLEETTESRLVSGDYLVRMNDGKYVVQTASDFEQVYLPIFKDNDLLPDHEKTIPENLLEVANEMFPEAGLGSLDDMTLEQRSQFVEAYRKDYDAEQDKFTLKFQDMSLTNFNDLGYALALFPSASYIKKTTKFVLNFNNGIGDHVKGTHNLFNYGALQSLVGELRRMPYDFTIRIVGITFNSADGEAPSAVAPSVTDDQWLTLGGALMAVTGIKAITDIKR